MKIAYLSVAPFNKTGYGNCTNEVVYRLLEKHEVDIYAWFGLQQASLDYPLGKDKGKEERQVKIIGTPLASVPSEWHWGLINKANDYDLIIAHCDMWAHWERLQQLAGSRWVYWTVLDHSPVPAPTRMLFKARVFVKGVPMTKWAGEELKKCPMIDNSKVAPAIYHGIDPDTFYPSPNPKMPLPDDCEFFVATVADNHGSRECLPTMIEGFAKFLKDTGANAYYYLHAYDQSVTGYNLKNCIVMCEELYNVKVMDRIGFKPEQIAPDSFMRDLYTKADCQLMTIAGGSFEIPVTEAGACGTPTIVTDFSAPPELVGHGERGLVVPMAAPVWNNMTSSRQAAINPADIAKALTIYYENPKLKQMHGKLMQEWVKENATWDIVGPQWVDLVDKLEDEIRGYGKAYFAIRLGFGGGTEDEMIRQRVAGKVLEIGCGLGELLTCLNQDGCQSEGVDISDYAVDICKERGFKVQKANAEELPFEDGQFNYACSCHLLEHCDDPMKALSESLRVAKNGVIHIVPGHTGRDLTHRRYYTREMMEELCQELQKDYLATFWPVEGAPDWVLEVKKGKI